MKKRIFLSVLAFLISLITIAASAEPPAYSELPAQGSFRLKVEFGDRQSEFLVWQLNGMNYYSAFSNDGRKRRGNLTSNNYNFLLNQAKSLVQSRNYASAQCPRLKVKLDMEGGKKSVSTCLNGKNSTTKKMTVLAGAMSLLY